MDEKYFEEARISVCNDIDREILNLKHFMEGIDEDTFGDDPKVIGEIVERIFYADEGLKKLAGVLSFIDCWEDNGDPPRLSQRATFNEKGGELKDWQKEIMMREVTLED